MTDWRDDTAACADDPELMYPPGTTWKHHPQQEAEAKAVCRTCPLKDACLQWALDTGDPYSIAGGTTPEERGVNEACGTYPGYARHRRAGEKPCDPCRFAYRAYTKARRDARKSA